MLRVAHQETHNESLLRLLAISVGFDLGVAACNRDQWLPVGSIDVRDIGEELTKAPQYSCRVLGALDVTGSPIDAIGNA